MFVCFRMIIFHYRPFNIVCYICIFLMTIYFDSAVFLLRCLWLKSFLWFPNRFFKVAAGRSKYIFVWSLASFSISAPYIKFRVWHWFWRGQLLFTPQLHPYSVILGWSNDLLCPAIIDDILLMQLQLIFLLFLLKILCNLLVFEKYFFSKLKNILTMFVFTLTK